MQTIQRHGATASRNNRLTIALLVIYMVVLCWVLLFKLGVEFSYMEKRSVNLIPFGKPLVSNGRADVGEIISNILVFVPLGLYAGMLFKRWRFVQQLILFFTVSLVIEGLQFALAIGAFDITDVITNTTGGLIGLLLFGVSEKAFGNSTKAQKVINLIASIATVLMVLFLLLLKMNLLPFRYQ